MTGAMADRVAVITGGRRGIGRAIAKGYVERGARVLVSSLHQDSLDRGLAAIGGGDAVRGRCADVGSPGQLAALFEFSESEFGGVDIVVISAGVSAEARRIEGSEPARWRQTVEANLIGAYHTARAAIPSLRRRGGGQIIVLGSGLGHKGMPGSSAYSCSKAGVSLLVQVLAEELRDDGICVNELIPGPDRHAGGGADQHHRLARRRGGVEQGSGRRGTAGRVPGRAGPAGSDRTGVQSDAAGGGVAARCVPRPSSILQGRAGAGCSNVMEGIC